MLERLQTVALMLRPVLPLAVVLGVGGAAVFLWAATRTGPTQGDALLIPGALAILWGAVLFAFITGFRNVPAPPRPVQPLWARTRARLTRGFHTLIAWIMLGATAVALFVSFRLLSLWLG
jgi:hypothetical protein